MFCYQCEQTVNGKGCTVKGVCGKNDEVASLLDCLTYITKGISMYANKAYKLGVRDIEIDKFVMESLFTTLTNVDFDPEMIVKIIHEAKDNRDKIKSLYEQACQVKGSEIEELYGPATLVIPETKEELIELGKKYSITARKEKYGEDIVALQELAFYGLKGAGSYMDHASLLLKDDIDLYEKFHEVISFVAQESTDIEALLSNALKVGEINFEAMKLLDSAHTETFGHPVPTKVRVTPIKGKCILISGHDLKDLEQLLIQTEGKGINIYTHGEMLPTHGYPQLNKYKHLVGNYGGAWQNQRSEFDAFPGSILMTTNCIQEPKSSYKDRLFTCGLVSWPDVTHISNQDFSAVIDKALEAKGFEEDSSEKYVTVGFGRNAVLSQAGTILEKIAEKKIRRFFLVGGCDGAKLGRDYYTEITEKIPEDCIILTLACGKYRFIKNEFGDIDGIPRLLDLGQCNDAYSAIAIVSALAEALDCGINDLPVSYVLSWYEQKAVAILLTLLHLGVKDIYLGPTLPAYFTPTILKVISDKYGLKKITTPDADLKEMLE